MSVFDKILSRTGRIALLGVLVGGVACWSNELTPKANAQDIVEHRSLVHLQRGNGVNPSQHIKIGLNKSVVVELPVDLRDVLVSNPKVLDAVVQSSRRAYLIGVKTGQANIHFFDKEGGHIAALEVSIERDLNALSRMFKRFIPDSDIRAEMVNENVVLTGTAANAADANRAADLASRFTGEAEKVLNMIAVTTNEQVMIRVQVAEMNREMIKRLGVNLNGGSIGNANLAFNTNNQFPISNQNGANSILYGVFGNNPSACTIPSTLSGNIIEPTTTLPTSALNCLASSIEAFERNGMLRTLAKPNLTAISGETANFLAGGEFPIPSGWDDGTIAVEYKPFGVGLSFTPVVMTAGRISLRISTEVSEISNEGAVTLASISIPALKVRRANTTVELPSGGSLVIGGLLSEDVRQNLDTIPGIKRVPILGKLFTSRDFIKNETELVVIVTPFLVKPVARQKLARPDDGFSPDSDRKMLLLNRLNRVYGDQPEYLPRGGGLKGEYGFIHR
ncbi:MAG: type II and III secretion system protein family protein [Methyloligellaceae bacterium]